MQRKKSPNGLHQSLPLRNHLASFFSMLLRKLGTPCLLGLTIFEKALDYSEFMTAGIYGELYFDPADSKIKLSLADCCFKKLKIYKPMREHTQSKTMSVMMQSSLYVLDANIRLILIRFWKHLRTTPI